MEEVKTPTEPLYRVGQQVVIASVNYPELNGQVHTVSGMKWMEAGRDIVSGKAYGPGWRYCLDDDVPFSERILRPYFPPSDQSFDEMMSEWTRTKERV